MGHFELPLILNHVPLNIVRGTLKYASFTHVPKYLNGSALIEFN
jgi:hypothetical protein